MRDEWERTAPSQRALGCAIALVLMLVAPTRAEPLDASVAVSERDAGAASALATDARAIDADTPESAPHDVSASPTAPAVSPPMREEVVEVTVHSAASQRQRLQRSADAVTVVDTQVAQQRSADLGEVVARVQGISLRRAGGLGSDMRFSLNGLSDEQVRFFLDGVPLELAGYPFKLANVPVNLISQIEIYRGVVPVRFGADALGGAVNLVGEQRSATGGGVSYQVGSFGTHRVTLDARFQHEPSGWYVAAAGFFDDAKNDYPIDVEVWDERGKLTPARVERFHDAYRAYGTRLEVGVLDRPWARRLALTGFVSGFQKELQHNVVMTVPYGEAEVGERVEGATLRYEQPLARRVELALVANYAHRTIDYLDVGTWIYNWYGEREHPRPGGGGEIDSPPSDETFWQHSGFARINVAWTIATAHVLRASVTPTYTTRTGQERIKSDPSGRDPLSAERDMLTLVCGLEYELNALPTRGAPRDADDYRISNVVFVKGYAYRTASEERMQSGEFQRRDQHAISAGGGDSMRFTFRKGIYAKASYEYATRLPRPDEVFGDGSITLANLELQPEVSHNANLGPHLEARRLVIGELSFDLNALLRDSAQLIVRREASGSSGGNGHYRFENVYRARALGLEAAFAWASPKRYLSVQANPSWIDQRNRSTSGAFAAFEGDRIPNRPYFFASWGGQLRFARLLHPGDALEPFYQGRYVHAFYRTWESAGQGPDVRAFKKEVDAQVTHALGTTYSLRAEHGGVAATLEVQNLTDARAYDFFGVQRPGRAFHLKISGEL